MRLTPEDMQQMAGNIVKELSEKGCTPLEILFIATEIREINTLNSALNSIFNLIAKGDRDKARDLLNQAIREAMGNPKYKE